MKTSTTRFKTTRDGASQPESQDGWKSSWCHHLRIDSDVISVNSPRGHLDNLQTLKIPTKFESMAETSFGYFFFFIILFQ